MQKVNWPEEEPRRRDLAEAGIPRLLIVASGVAPPLCVEVLEDWVRTADHDRDAKTRIDALAARWENIQDRTAPHLHDEGVLEFRASRTEISPLQALLVRPMVDHFGRVVTRGELAREGWKGVDIHRNTLDAHMFRLRQRVGCVGLTLRTVRSRGYLLTAGNAVAISG